MRQPLVSVIMPVYNNAATLSRAVYSILRQSLRDLELIIIDDGSEDKSYAVAARMRDPRIRLYRNEKNCGVSATRNRGIELMQSGFMAPMDADDVSPGKRLERAFALLQKNPSLGMCGGFTRWSGWGWRSFVERQPTGVNAFRAYMLFNMPTHHGALMVRKAVLDRHGIRYRENLHAAIDLDLLYTLQRYTEGDNVPAIMSHYHYNPRGITAKKSSIAYQVRSRAIGPLLEQLLGRPCVGREIEWHMRVGNGCGMSSVEELTEAAAWLQSLRDANTVQKQYDLNAFDQVLSFVWYRCCRNSTPLGRKARQVWRSVPWYGAHRAPWAEEFSWLGTWALSCLVRNCPPQGALAGAASTSS